MSDIDPVTTLDTPRLTRWLESNLPGFQPPVSMRKFGDGQSNPTFLLSTGSGSFVLRRKPPGELLASAHAVDREFRVLTALTDSDLPIATPYVLCDDNSIIGSMFYVMSYEPGDIFWDPALPEVEREQRPAYYRELVTTLARLHSFDYQAAGLSDFGKPGNYFSRQLDRWTRQYRASATQEIAAMDTLIKWLDKNMPEGDGDSTLIHGDYRLDNVIFHKDRPSIRAILDWELATIGHPLADLAYYCMALRLPNKGQLRGLGNQSRESLNIPDETTLVRWYCEKRQIEDVKNWPFCMAFCFFRLAAILQGVYKRGLDGNASSERAMRMGELVRPLAEMGMEATRKI